MAKKKMKMPKSTLALLVVAIGLLLFTTVGGARAALTYFSDTYTSQFNMRHIGITLLENGEPVSARNYNVNQSDNLEGNWQYSGDGILLTNMLAEGEDLVLGHTYDEKLSVKNTSSDGNENGIDEYVRVTVRKYWLQPDGKTKATDLSPELIEIHFTDTDWILDEASHTEERDVLYYRHILPVDEETLTPFADTLTISDKVPYTVKQTETKDENGKTVITTTYKYDGYQFVLEAEADGVQTHNAKDAIRSAWGVEASFSGDEITGVTH